MSIQMKVNRLGLILIACIITGTAYAWYTLSSPPQNLEDDVSAHAATAMRRSLAQSAANVQEVQIARVGIERDTAGVHLLRPAEDPLWAQYGAFQPSSGYRWWSVKVAYPGLLYQLYPGSEIDLNPTRYSCLLSQSRLLPNPIGDASFAQQSDGTYSVTITISPRGRAALEHLLAPAQVLADGSFIDWFSILQPATGTSTPMKVCVVASKKAYLPIEIQPLLNHPPGDVQVTVASGLPMAEAQMLVDRLSRP